MAWTTPSDHGATVVTQAEWNNFHGTSGNCAYLKALADAIMKAQKDGGSVIGGRAKFNFITGANMTLTVADDAGNDRVNVTIASSALSTPTAAESSSGSTVYTQTVTASSTADTKGSWEELIATTTRASKYIAVQCYATNGETFLLDIGVGAGPSVLIPDIYVLGVTSKQDNYIFPVAIDSGTSVHARCQSDAGGASKYVYIAIQLLG